MEGLYAERVVRPDVRRGLGRRGDADDDRDLDPVPPQLPRLPGHHTPRSQGIDSFAPDPTPPINLVFQVYHFMITMGPALAGDRRAGRADVPAGSGASSSPRFVLWLLVLTVFLGEATITAGWWTAEIGRQPWVVYDVLKTADGVSPVLTATDVVLSLGMFVVLYALLLVLFLYLLNRKIQAGPGGARGGRDRGESEPAGHVPRRLPPQRAARPTWRRAMTLNEVWFVLFILIIAGYLILDGFDMGVGILLLPLARTDVERRTFLNSIGPVWDGNEVWLVLGGGVLFAVFPLAYASLFSGMYLAFMLVLLVLILRTVALEFRSQGGVAALAVGLGHGLRGGVGRARAAARRRLREHRVRAAGRRRRQHLDRLDRPADAVRTARRGDDRRDVRGPGRHLPDAQDRGRAPRPDRAGGAAPDDRRSSCSTRWSWSRWSCSTRTSRSATSTTSGRSSSRPPPSSRSGRHG